MGNSMSRFYRLVVLLLVTISLGIASRAGAQEGLNELLRDESASGARAAMGLFSSPFNKYFCKHVLGLSPHSFAGHFSSLILAAASYQTVYYDPDFGVQVDPFVLHKSWRGFWTGYFSAEGIDLAIWLAKKSRHANLFIASSLVLATAAIAVDGEVNNTWRQAEDSPLTLDNLILNRHSYWTHFAATGGLYWMLSNQTDTPFKAYLYTIGLTWLWEFKDGYVRTESKFRYLGGEGFSLSDAMAGILAASGSFLLDQLIIHPFKCWLHHSTNLSFSLTNYQPYSGFSVTFFWN